MTKFIVNSTTKIQSSGLLCNLKDLENLEKSGNLIFDSKKSRNFSFLSKVLEKKLREKNLTLGAVFLPTIKLLSIVSYIHTFYFLFLSLKIKIYQSSVIERF